MKTSGSLGIPVTRRSKRLLSLSRNAGGPGKVPRNVIVVGPGKVVNVANVPGNIYDQLKRDEGFRSKPYLDTVGKATIGYGRNLEAKGITEAEAFQMLNDDVAEVIGELTLHGYPLEENNPRYWVLVNMAFNLGVQGLLAFKLMLAAYKNGDFVLAAKEMMDSRWSHQVGPRAHRLAVQMETGVWQ